MFRMNYVDYELISHYEPRRGGFRHVTTLLYPDGRNITVNVNYVNRTWEKWQYRTACIKALEKAIAIELDNARACFLSANGYKRLTDKRQGAFEKWIANNPHYGTIINDLHCFLIKVRRA